MLSRATINIIRKSICNSARTLYCMRNSLQTNLLMHDDSIKQHSVQNHCNLYVAKRFKSSRKKIANNKKRKDEDSDEEEEKGEEEAPVGSKVLSVNIQSIRLDVVSKAGFGLSRNKIEEAFYASKFRVNGKKVFKKSIEVEVGDEIDMVLRRNEDNPKLLFINRIVVLSMNPVKDPLGIRIKFSRDKNLLIEDYEDPYGAPE